MGTDNVDVKAATKRELPVMFTPGANYESVAEHTLASILTTHIGGMSGNSLKNMEMGAVKNVLAVLKGDSFDMEALVNKEIVEK